MATFVYMYISAIVDVVLFVYILNRLLSYTSLAAWSVNLHIPHIFRTKSSPPSYCELFIYALLVGLYTQSPLLSLLSLDPHAPIDNVYTFIFYILNVLTVLIPYCLIFYVFIITIKKLSQIFAKHNKVLKVSEFILLSIIISLAELFKSIAFSLLFAGSNSVAGINNMCLTLADALAVTPLIRLAYFGHIYYLAFILSIIILTLFLSKHLIKLHFFNTISHYKYSLTKRLIIVTIPIITISILISVQLFYVYFQRLVYEERMQTLGGTNYPDINFLIIPSDIPTHYEHASTAAQAIYNEAKASNDQRLHEIISNTKNIDQVILPETIYYEPSLPLRSKRSAYLGPPIVGGILLDNGKQISNNTLYIDPANGVITREKSYLFPFYEYRPWMSMIAPMYNLTMGTHTNTDFYADIARPLDVEKIYRFTSIICSEFYSFEYIHSLRKARYDYIITQMSLASFHHSKWLYTNTLMTQMINSQYMNTPIIQVSNSGPSFVILNGKLTFYSENSRPFIINMNRSVDSQD